MRNLFDLNGLYSFLTSLLTIKNDRLRAETAKTLAILYRDRADKRKEIFSILSQIIQVGSGEEGEMQLVAIKALGDLGVYDKTLLERLEEIFKLGWPIFLRPVAVTIYKLTLSHPPLIDRFTDLAKSTNPDLREEAALGYEQLANWLRERKLSTDDLRKKILAFSEREKDSDVLWILASILGIVGRETKGEGINSSEDSEVLEQLFKLTFASSREEERVVEKAVESLGKLNPQTFKFIDRIGNRACWRRRLPEDQWGSDPEKYPHPHVQYAAVLALGGIKRKTPNLADVLILSHQAKDSGYAFIRKGATSSIVKLIAQFLGKGLELYTEK